MPFILSIGKSINNHYINIIKYSENSGNLTFTQWKKDWLSRDNNSDLISDDVLSVLGASITDVLEGVGLIEKVVLKNSVNKNIVYVFRITNKDIISLNIKNKIVTTTGKLPMIVSPKYYGD